MGNNEYRISAEIALLILNFIYHYYAENGSYQR